MRKKAVYHVLDRLINHDWKTRLSLTAAPDGSVSFRGFRGTYRVRGTGADGQPCEKTVKVR